VSFGESVYLQLRFEGGEPGSPPQIPQVAGLKVQLVQGPERRIMSDGVSVTREYVLTYLVTPLQAGEHTIPAIQADVGGRRLATQPLKLRVLKTSDGGPGVAGQNKQAFLRLVTPKTEVYVGEVLPVEVKLYVTGAQDLQWQPLAAEGFTLGKTVEMPRSQAQVGATVYATTGFRLTAVATKTGPLQLGPAECSLNLHVAAVRRAPRMDLFDDMFDSFWGRRVELRPARLVSETVAIQVLPLPRENVPAGFTGAVGEYSLELTAGPTNVAVGEPITLKVRIAGRGALDSVTLPSLEGWRGFKVYPPTSRIETTDALGVEGAKFFEQVIVPQSTDVAEVPVFAFAFFNPERKAYRTVTRPAVPLIVRPAGSGLGLASLRSSESPDDGSGPARRDIVHLKPRLGTLGTMRAPMLYQRWFVTLQAVPVLAWVAALVWRKRREHFASNPRLVRRRTVARSVRRGLGELKRLAVANDAERFYALVFRLLQEQLGERLDLPSGAITEAIVEERLAPRGVPQDLQEAVSRLFRACNQARYAHQSTEQELQAWLPTVEATLGQLASLDL
jgi:hypothetical protein